MPEEFPKDPFWGLFCLTLPLAQIRDNNKINYHNYADRRGHDNPIQVLSKCIEQIALCQNFGETWQAKTLIFHLGLFCFLNTSSFRLVGEKNPKYTFSSLFYCSMSLCVCRFRLKDSILPPHVLPLSLSAPYVHRFQWKAPSLQHSAVGSKCGHFLRLRNKL